MSFKHLRRYVTEFAARHNVRDLNTIDQIAGEKLTDQELRNAVYSGSWVTDAKRYFSKNQCPASGLGGDYLGGTPIRQDFQETVIKWISGGDIEEYMAQRQHERRRQRSRRGSLV